MIFSKQYGKNKSPPYLYTSITTFWNFRFQISRKFCRRYYMHSDVCVQFSKLKMHSFEQWKAHFFCDNGLFLMSKIFLIEISNDHIFVDIFLDMTIVSIFVLIYNWIVDPGLLKFSFLKFWIKISNIWTFSIGWISGWIIFVSICHPNIKQFISSLL